ncbi:hypothetical protein DEFDS_P152 (plasmid) [Deferribacter desulfuricans SSM1]|uniref:Uncharacterized protein n=1 Tax=Deferribacter desulfuricans (strain DSM 14783 / JCM 11476 / NBRC 101012 / SSM1) TaxID=639282 RepID=D3PEY1_DEFDS|nr:hypothetical protein [Deferribacter desulfuricans]BAI81773.1 hypothetical protein DEFDS_P152 [Deferribacter desulfuricans SSM1]
MKYNLFKYRIITDDKLIYKDDYLYHLFLNVVKKNDNENTRNLFQIYLNHLNEENVLISPKRKLYMCPLTDIYKACLGTGYFEYIIVSEILKSDRLFSYVSLDDILFEEQVITVKPIDYKNLVADINHTYQIKNKFFNFNIVKLSNNFTTGINLHKYRVGKYEFQLYKATIERALFDVFLYEYKNKIRLLNDNDYDLSEFNNRKFYDIINYVIKDSTYKNYINSRFQNIIKCYTINEEMFL